MKQSKLIAFWIFKTFTRWLASKEGESTLLLRPSKYRDLTYYPAKLNHNTKLPDCSPDEPGDWYLKRAHELWQMMLSGQIPLVHDAYLKWAQLRGLDLDEFTAILLDEAQDCTECQLDAFVTQVRHADVFIVGDMAQALYSWRLAAPQQLASLNEPQSRGKWYFTLHGQLAAKQQPPREVKCTKLRRTFRFGDSIGR